ncbi:MAG: hypothetical protein V7629_06230 [Motiliproteus sp.]
MKTDRVHNSGALIDLQGIITITTGRYLFRADHAFGTDIWAWNIHDELGAGDRVMPHKWKN